MDVPDNIAGQATLLRRKIGKEQYRLSQNGLTQKEARRIAVSTVAREINPSLTGNLLEKYLGTLTSEIRKAGTSRRTVKTQEITLDLPKDKIRTLAEGKGPLPTAAVMGQLVGRSRERIRQILSELESEGYRFEGGGDAIRVVTRPIPKPPELPVSRPPAPEHPVPEHDDPVAAGTTMIHQNMNPAPALDQVICTQLIQISNELKMTNQLLTTLVAIWRE
jgi:hypothetical protein